jgi:hypothetical protein
MAFRSNDCCTVKPTPQTLTSPLPPQLKPYPSNCSGGGFAIILPAIINSERFYAVSAAQDLSMKPDLNEKSRVTATKNFEFGIAVILLRLGRDSGPTGIKWIHCFVF